MVAKITFPKRVEAALNYNERKVRLGKALCLGASGYLREAGEMNFYQKLSGLERRNTLNHRATTKTLHVSLNLNPSEKLPDSRLEEIGRLYMEKIGFGEQPFLIYKHEDAGHPHIHIVSTTVRQDGSRINTHNMGRNQSEKARKELEALYGLMKAEKRRELTPASVGQVPLPKAVYGRQETKRSISTIVGLIYHQYRFGSLPEYNAALKQFNVVADRGKEGGRIYNHGGLVYRLLDSEGAKVGVPIKASSIFCGPTLKNLERKFAANAKQKEALKQPLKAKIDRCVTTAQTMAELTAALHQQDIYLLLRQSAGGRIYGITFVDNQTHAVFNGSDLGKEYAASAIPSRLSKEQKEGQQKEATNAGAFREDHLQKRLPPLPEKSVAVPTTGNAIFTHLLPTKEPYENVPVSLLKKKRKKKKRND